MKADRDIIRLAMALALAMFTSSALSDSSSTSYRRLHQGGKWTTENWKTFYSLDQGSLIIPYPWAAPYLHNGSVPSLTELLKPAALRVRTFQVGPEYDISNVGLAANQSGGQSSVRVTTGCSDADKSSGNSNCGHEFGVALSSTEKEALIEYLKTL